MVPQALLDALGRSASQLVTLDFETYYGADYTLAKMTTESYIRDPRFETIGVSVKWGREPAVWMEAWDFQSWAQRQDWTRLIVLAHHAHFEGLILSHHYDVRPGFWLDTLSMARARYGIEVGGSLAKLAEHLGVGKKGDAVHNVKGMRRADFSTAAWNRYGLYGCNDVELTLACYRAMKAELPPEEFWVIDSTARFFSEPALMGNRAKLSATLAKERARKKVLLERVAGVQCATVEDALEHARSTLASSDKLAGEFRKLGVEPPVKDGKNGEIFAFAKSDAGMQALLEHEDEDVRLLAEARLAVMSTLVETRAECLLGMSQRGAMSIYLKYAAAHTYRWGGSDGSNMQNLNRDGELRDALEAPPGHLLVVADSGQIEARVVASCAGEGRLLDTFRRNDETGGDFYSDVGGQFFGRKLSKQETPVERQTAKSMVLGLGFQLGWRSFCVSLAKGFLGAPPVVFDEVQARQYRVNVAAFTLTPFAGSTCGELTAEALDKSGLRVDPGAFLVHAAVTKHFVDLYRKTYRRIVALWYAFQDALPLMAEDGPEGVVRGKVGPVEIVRHGLRKPNGMVLRYPGLRGGPDGYSYLEGHGKKRAGVYGGKLTENVVQSLARDIIAEQLLWVRAGGYQVVTTTHDEIVACVPEAQAEKALADMKGAMRRPPAWCADLPLNASGAIGRSYGEAK